MPKDYVSTNKSKLSTERHSNRVVEIADASAQLNYGAIAIFKAFPEHLDDFFRNNANYFTGAAFAANVISNVAYLFRFIVTPNKNISRVANLALRAASFALVVVTTFATAYLGATVLLALLGVSSLIFPVLHMAKSAYFFYKYKTADDMHKQFFWDKFVRNLVVAVVSTVIVAAMMTLFALAAPIIATVGAPLLMGVGIGAALLILVSQIWKTVPFFQSLSKSEPEETAKAIRKQESTLHILTRTTSKIIERQFSGIHFLDALKKMTIKPKRKHEKILAPVDPFNFFQYSVTPAINEWKPFLAEVAELKEAVHDHHKRRALEFLQTFVEEIPKIPTFATKVKPHYIGGLPFYYKNKEELVQKLETTVLRNNARAYTSFFKDVGRVQALYRAAFHKFLKKDESKHQAVTTDFLIKKH